MMNISKNLAAGCLFAIALSALISIRCVAQVSDTTHLPKVTPSPSRAGSTGVTNGKEADAGTSDPATTTSPSKGGNPQGGISGLTSRVKVFSHNGPRRDSW